MACYKVEFTSGVCFMPTVNAETGAVMEMSNSQNRMYRLPDADGGGRLCSLCPFAAQTSAPATAQTVTGIGTVDEAAAQKIALEHAGVKAADATITKSKLDYEDAPPGI